MGYLRLLGIIPLVLFFIKLKSDMRRGKAGDSLWICHVSNLGLSFGLILNLPILVRLSVICIIYGFPLWILEVIRTKEIIVPSILTHLTGLGIGLFAISKVRMTETAWIYALAWFVFIQQISRFVTPVVLNVNLAHRVHNGWEKFFKSYKSFWLCSKMVEGTSLWCIVKVLQSVFPVTYLTWR